MEQFIQTNMKIEILRKRLIDALAVGGQMEGKTTVPSTEVTKIKIEPGSLKVTSTNMAIFISKAVEIDYTGEPVQFCLSGKVLLGILKSISDESITLDVEEKILTVVHIKGTAELPLLAADTYPMPKITGEAQSITVDAAFFVENINHAVKYVLESKDEDKPCMKCVRCYFHDGKFCVAASNGYYIYVNRKPYDMSVFETTPADVLIPAKAVSVLKSIIPMDGTVTIKNRENNFSVSVNGCNLFVTKVEGRYPDSERVLLRETKRGRLSLSELSAAVTRTSMLANKLNGLIKLTFESDRVRVEGKDIDFRTAGKEYCDCEGELAGMFINLSAKWLSVVLSDFPSENVGVCLVNETRLLQLVTDDYPYLVVGIMPLDPNLS